MCKQCEKKPVYEFTNQRKLCANCFVRWFQKKVLYSIRKFGMIERGDAIGFENNGGVRDVVLENVLRMVAEKGCVELIELHSQASPRDDSAEPRELIASRQTSSKRFEKNKVRDKFFVNNILARKSGETDFGANNSRARRGKFPTKLALPDTTDQIAGEIVESVVRGKVSVHPPVSLVRKSRSHPPVSAFGADKLLSEPKSSLPIIRPLYLFLDKEVLLYAKLRGLKYLHSPSARGIKETDNKKTRGSSTINFKNSRATLERDKWKKNGASAHPPTRLQKFIEDLEKKHPEVKHAIVNGMLGIGN